MKIRSVFVSLLLTAAILLSACQAVPDVVTDEINDYASISNSDVKKELEYADIDTVIDTTQRQLSNYNQLTLKGLTAKLPQKGAAIHELKLKIDGFFDEKTPDEVVRSIAAEQFPDISLDDVVNDKSEQLYNKREGVSYYCDKRNMISAAGNEGVVCFNRGASLDYCDYYTSENYEKNGVGALTGWIPSYNFEAERIISLHNGEKAEDGLSYPLVSGQVKVSDALAYAKDFLNSFLAKYEGNAFTYDIRKIYIRKMQNGKYGYEFTGERLYDGIPIDTFPYYGDDGADFGGDGYYMEGPGFITLWMVEADKIDAFRCETRLKAEKEADVSDKILTLDSALDIVSSSLSSASAIRCMSVELLYVNGYYADRPFTYEDQNTPEKLEQVRNYPRKTRLMWAVLIYMPNSPLGTFEYPHDPHYTVFVDAVTAEVIGYYDLSGRYGY